jgi:hypothetical protein
MVVGLQASWLEVAPCRNVKVLVYAKHTCSFQGRLPRDCPLKSWVSQTLWGMQGQLLLCLLPWTAHCHPLAVQTHHLHGTSVRKRDHNQSACAGECRWSVADTHEATSMASWMLSWVCMGTVPEVASASSVCSKNTVDRPDSANAFKAAAAASRSPAGSTGTTE